MKLKRNKLVSLFLIFFLLILSGNLYAKKRGADLIIQKKDGHLIRGELIAVKEHSLLLLSATDVSIDIGDIKVIEIEKKSQIGKGVVYGLLIIGCGGTLLGGILGSGSEDFGFWGGAWIGSLISVPSGALIGAIIGAVAGLGEKTIRFEGMTDSEIQEALEKLRKKARIRDYK